MHRTCSTPFPLPERLACGWSLKALDMMSLAGPFPFNTYRLMGTDDNRLSGSDALFIQTHNMRGLRLNHTDSRALAIGGIASLKVQAGERMVDIYNFAAMNDVTVVGRGEVNVGIGGCISYGGHGKSSG
jgi:hypothetical protein